jgi:hypothetical protein
MASVHDVAALSEGLFVALRRRSSFNGNAASDEHLATSAGTTWLEQPPGEYDVLVRDERFGWGAGSRAKRSWSSCGILPA